MNSTVQVITIVILLVTFVITVISTQFARRKRSAFPLRHISAYAALPHMIGIAVESDRPLHLSYGSTSLGGNTTLLALASSELFYQVSLAAVSGAVSPIYTMSEPSVLPLAFGTLYRAYKNRSQLIQPVPNQVRWMPAGDRSLAFAGILTGASANDNPTGHILTGSFGAELALLLDHAHRHRQMTFAASDQLEGQAIAYALAEHTLIGEEIYTSGAYLGDSATQVGSVVTLDLLRWGLVLALLVGGFTVLRDPFTEALSRLLGGS